MLKLFGENGSKIKTQIAEIMKKFKPSRATGSDGNKKLDSTNAPDELSGIAVYYTIKRSVEEEQEKKKTKASFSCPTKTDKAQKEPKKTADECKKNTTDKPCKDEKGCDFDDKKPEGEKCFPKAENDKKDEKSSSSNLRVSVSHVFAALVFVSF
uniref:Variant surface glycoprotein n=1 Tax=Trypanosoma brucei TaxID=5691 RepID=A0A1V0FYR4_9TRYP|nr:variant surface glycoprotein [Trypanosoma brucei]